MSSDRKRGLHNKKPKKVILISCEGKTEEIYFKNFFDREKEFRIVFVPGNETDPVNMVSQTINKINNLGLHVEDYLAYCVFDTDIDINKNKQIAEASEIVKKSKIQLILSSPCIEIWFLQHYRKSTAKMNNKEAIKELKKYHDKYTKTYNIYNAICGNQSVAILNAKELEEYHISNKINLQTIKANPYTAVYKVVKELIK